MPVNNDQINQIHALITSGKLSAAAVNNILSGLVKAPAGGPPPPPPPPGTKAAPPPPPPPGGAKAGAQAADVDQQLKTIEVLAALNGQPGLEQAYTDISNHLLKPNVKKEVKFDAAAILQKNSSANIQNEVAQQTLRLFLKYNLKDTGLGKADADKLDAMRLKAAQYIVAINKIVSTATVDADTLNNFINKVSKESNPELLDKIFKENTQTSGADLKLAQQYFNTNKANDYKALKDARDNISGQMTVISQEFDTKFATIEAAEKANADANQILQQLQQLNADTKAKENAVDTKALDLSSKEKEVLKNQTQRLKNITTWEEQQVPIQMEIANLRAQLPATGKLTFKQRQLKKTITSKEAEVTQLQHSIAQAQADNQNNLEVYYAALIKKDMLEGITTPKYTKLTSLENHVNRKTGKSKTIKTEQHTPVGLIAQVKDLGLFLVVPNDFKDANKNLEKAIREITGNKQIELKSEQEFTDMLAASSKTLQIDTQMYPVLDVLSPEQIVAISSFDIQNAEDVANELNNPNAKITDRSRSYFATQMAAKNAFGYPELMAMALGMRSIDECNDELGTKADEGYTFDPDLGLNSDPANRLEGKVTLKGPSKGAGESEPDVVINGVDLKYTNQDVLSNLIGASKSFLQQFTQKMQLSINEINACLTQLGNLNAPKDNIDTFAGELARLQGTNIQFHQQAYIDHFGTQPPNAVADYQSPASKTALVKCGLASIEHYANNLKLEKDITLLLNNVKEAVATQKDLVAKQKIAVANNPADPNAAVEKQIQKDLNDANIKLQTQEGVFNYLQNNNGFPDAESKAKLEKEIADLKAEVSRLEALLANKEQIQLTPEKIAELQKELKDTKDELVAQRQNVLTFQQQATQEKQRADVAEAALAARPVVVQNVNVSVEALYQQANGNMKTLVELYQQHFPNNDLGQSQSTLEGIVRAQIKAKGPQNTAITQLRSAIQEATSKRKATP